MSRVTSPIDASALSLEQRVARPRRKLEHHSLAQTSVPELEIDVEPAGKLVHDRDPRRHEPHTLGVEVDAGRDLVAGRPREQLKRALERAPAEVAAHDAAHRGGAAA